MTRRSAITLAMISALTFAGPALAEDADAEKGKKVFKKCQACHAVGEGAKNKVGPELNNIVGAKAGSRGDFKYSAAMKEAGENGLVWNDENLDKYLKKPRALVPKGKMAFAGLRKDEDRLNVIAYLKQFSDSQ
jgi:cytochrome c